MTDPMCDALMFLYRRRSQGEIDRSGRIVAKVETSSCHAKTFLGLVAWGYLAGGDQRLWLTDSGKRMAMGIESGKLK